MGRTVLALLLGLVLAVPAQSQDSARIKLAKSIQWARGPVMGQLGEEAQVSVPANCRFTGAKGAKTFMEVTENPPSGNEHGIMLCQSADTAMGVWFVVFSYEASGYVKDDEGKTLDGAAILRTIKEGTEDGNAERRERGWGAIYIDGWQRSPFYDERTHNLTWSTRLHDETGDASINHSVRLLGRGGVMHADLVIDPKQMETAVPAFDAIIGNYKFNAGHTYAEWRTGDKMAGYGLTALIAGGAGVAAAKSGLLAKLLKPIVAFLIAAKKLVVAMVVGFVAWIKSLFAKRKRAAGPATP